ncbi:MAG: hypothetical protein K2I20_05510 [Clostridia bacterium]|nr:hypothetical protein [Clostridia bacterium]
MRKKFIAILSILCAGTAIGGVACAGGEQLPASVINGGFESADLSGWTVEYGNAFTDDCVISKNEFSYDYDANHTQIPVGQTGNWYLCGKADGSYSNARTGAIRSNDFVIPEDGTISMKLAGGSPRVGKDAGAASKSKEKLCYVGVYRASDNKMIAMQTNDYFLEHTESYVNLAQYKAGVYCTDNFCDYTLDLSAYAGEKAYIRIVDNDEHFYYGYLSVDDIRIGGDALAQTEGEYFVKSKIYQTEAQAPSEYDIANGGFETGSLAGWKIVEGEAFSHDGVNAESVWWNENITYSRDGNFHYGHYMPAATGVMRSSEFKLGGSGYISWKLGGCQNNGLTYLRFMLKGEEKDTEIAKFSNFKYWNFQFPHVANGMRLLNMVQYYADFSEYLGRTMYIEVVDKNSSTDELGCITLDSVKTYWEEAPVWYDTEAYRAVISDNYDVIPDSEHQVINGNFETGDLNGWTLSDPEHPIGRVVNEEFCLGRPYNKKGNYLFTGFEHDGQKLEGNTGTLTSSEFVLGGTGWITYRLGGGKDSSLCYLSVLDAENGTELARFFNMYFNDGSMSAYKADLTKFLGKKIKLQLVDNAHDDWGLLIADSFITYYENEKAIPSEAKLAIDKLPMLEDENKYQVFNGCFDTGDLTGWTCVNGEVPGAVSSNNKYFSGASYGKEGNFLFTAIEGYNGEPNPSPALEHRMGTIRSREFTLRAGGWISFKLGGAINPTTGIRVVRASDGAVLGEFNHTAVSPAGEGVLAQYIYQFTEVTEETECYIEIFDNAPNEGPDVKPWRLVAVDAITTDYQSKPELENAVTATNNK